MSLAFLASRCSEEDCATSNDTLRSYTCAARARLAPIPIPRASSFMRIMTYLPLGVALKPLNGGPMGHVLGLCGCAGESDREGASERLAPLVAGVVELSG